MQIKALILFGNNGQQRILPFTLGSVNIITGKSKTGKSVIGDIIDYCFGGNSCNIAEGFVRENVDWYALQLEHYGEYILIARRNPPRGQSSTNSCCYIMGANEIPSDLSKATPIDNNGLEEILSRKLGIAENLLTPPKDQSRQPLSANIRHTLFYCIQNQDEIASQKFIFHRQSEPFMPQAIKDTLLYFLGIVDENTLALEAERTRLRRESAILRRSINEVEQIKGNGLQRAVELLSEAVEVGLLHNNNVVDKLDYGSVKSALSNINQIDSINVEVSGMDRISLLQSQLEKIERETDELSIDIRNSEEFLGQVRGYSAEIKHQQERLESIGLFEQIDFDSTRCPFCSEPLSEPLPNGKDIRNAITVLSNKLNIVSRERPQLRKYIDDLNTKRQILKERADSIRLEINAIYEENKEAIQIRDLNARRARIAGRISLWNESVVISDESAHVKAKLENIESRIKELDKILDVGEIEGRKQSIINRISSAMSDWAKILNLEHSEYPYRLDYNKLTVMVDRDRPVPLQQLGSGSNWLGCHLIVLFSLHKFFRNSDRPVPSFLFLDQPSQVYFPPETNDLDVDSYEVRKIYEFIFERVKDIYPQMQVIVVDHADINEEYFQSAIVEKWWDGTKLVPTEWGTN